MVAKSTRNFHLRVRFHTEKIHCKFKGLFTGSESECKGEKDQTTSRVDQRIYDIHQRNVSLPLLLGMNGPLIGAAY